MAPAAEEPASDPRSVAGKPVTFQDIPYAGEGPPDGAVDVPATEDVLVGAEARQAEAVGIPAFLRRAQPEDKAPANG